MNEPKRLYLDTEVVHPAGRRKVSICRTSDTDIEYTRTDAFIEKACKGIEHLLSGYIIRNFHFGDSYEMDTLIEDFKKYMEE